MKNRKPHDWERDEDILAFYLCRVKCNGKVDKQITFEAVLECMLVQHKNERDFEGREISLRGSLKSRISDFKKFEGGYPTHNSSKSERVYFTYKDMDIEEHRKKCLRILGL